MNQPPPLSTSPAPQRTALAVISLVLGIFACILSFVLIGGLLGIIGLLLGMAYVKKSVGAKKVAWWGISLSILGILASVACGALYVEGFRQFKQWASSATKSGEFGQWQGVLAPDLSVTTLDGKTIQLSDLKGKRVIVDFWATWCGPCVREIPHFIRLHKETSRDDLVIVGISSEDKETLESFVKRQEINYPIATASELPEPYKNVHAIPTTFFIDRNGVIQSVVVGYHEFSDLKKLALAPNFEGDPKPAPTSSVAEPQQPGAQ
jgi:peroxiredoxin